MNSHNYQTQEYCSGAKWGTFFLFLAGGLMLNARPALAELGTVEGHVILVQKTAKGEEKVVKNKSLANIVIFLVADGHTVPVTVPKPAKISQKGAKFDPLVMAIVQGQSVQFPNDDNIDHNVFSFAKAKRFDLGLYKSGASKSVVFDQTGPVPLFCSIHSNMNAFIYVCPNHLYAITNDQGKFSIPSVPIGKYKVRTWHRNLPEGTEFLEVTKVDVEQGRSISVKLNLGAVEEE